MNSTFEIIVLVVLVVVVVGSLPFLIGLITLSYGGSEDVSGLTSTKARSITVRVREQEKIEGLQKILYSIKVQASRGETEQIWFGMTDYEKQELERAGFTVTKEGRRDYLIKW